MSKFVKILSKLLHNLPALENREPFLGYTLDAEASTEDTAGDCRIGVGVTAKRYHVDDAVGKVFSICRRLHCGMQ